jgi:hypothetical protein
MKAAVILKIELDKADCWEKLYYFGTNTYEARTVED